MGKIEVSTGDLRYLYSRLNEDIIECMAEVVPPENAAVRGAAQELAVTEAKKGFEALRYAVAATDMNVDHLEAFRTYCEAQYGVVPLDKDLNRQVFDALAEVGVMAMQVVERRRAVPTKVMKLYEDFVEKRLNQLDNALEKASQPPDQARTADPSPDTDYSELQELSEEYNEAGKEYKALSQQLDRLSSSLQQLNDVFAPQPDQP